MIKKYTMLVIMLFITTAPYYEYVLCSAKISGNGISKILWVLINGITLILPMLTSLLIKKEKQIVYYILISYTALAIGCYIYEMSYAAFYRPEYGVKGYIIIRLSVAAIKTLFVIAMYIMCELMFEEDGIAEGLIVKIRLKKLRRKLSKY